MPSRPGQARLLFITFTTYMHEYHASDKADALAVSCVTIGHSVSMEHPPQGGLAALLLRAGKVRMGGKRTTCTWEEIIHPKKKKNHMYQ